MRSLKGAQYCLVIATGLSGAPTWAESSAHCQIQDHLFATTPAPVADSDRITIFAEDALFEEGRQIEMFGDVEIYRPPYFVSGEDAQVNQVTGAIDLSKGVKIAGPDLEFSGAEAAVNLDAETISISDAAFLFPKQAKGKAEQLTHDENRVARLLEGSFTTCLLEEPEWHIEAEEIELHRNDGVGFAYHTKFKVHDTTIFYLPWFRFPIDDRRESGFLYPAIGTSNTGTGLSLSAPIYWNIDPQYDLTYTPRFIGGRGFLNDLQTRYLSAFGQSELEGGFIAKDSAFAESPGEDGKRWAFSFKHVFDAQAIGGWRGGINYAAVSDEDYLTDLNESFRIAQADHINRSAHLTWQGDQNQVSFLLQGFQTVEDDIDDEDIPFQRLPEIQFKRHASLSSGLGDVMLAWRSDATYFTRQVDADINKAARIRHYPQVSTMHHLNGLNLKPALTLDHTDYFIEGEHESRSVPIASADMSLTFVKNFSRLSHQLSPRVKYIYSPDANETDLPLLDTADMTLAYDQLFDDYRFSGGDRVGDDHGVAVGIENTFYSARSGERILDFSLGQRYALTRSRQSVTTSKETKRESPIASKLRWHPSDNISVAADHTWDERQELTASSGAGITYHSNDFDKLLSFSHRYLADDIEQTDLAALYPISEDTSIFGRWLFDLNSHNTAGTLVGLEMSGCCWRTQFIAQNYLTDDGQLDSEFLIRFQLSGIGQFGADADALDQLIPGYSAREERFNLR